LIHRFCADSPDRHLGGEDANPNPDAETDRGGSEAERENRTERQNRTERENRTERKNRAGQTGRESRRASRSGPGGKRNQTRARHQARRPIRPGREGGLDAGGRSGARADPSRAGSGAGRWAGDQTGAARGARDRLGARSWTRKRVVPGDRRAPRAGVAFRQMRARIASASRSAAPGACRRKSDGSVSSSSMSVGVPSGPGMRSTRA
jgi:hypothetical protein